MNGPHQDQPLETGGDSLTNAEGAVVLLHGRGATARGMLQLANEFARDGVAFLAPQAQNGSWYPNSFLAPLEANEPGLSSGLRAIESALETAAEADVSPERTLLLGFSQGACLASEFVARNARRYGGLAALSGGLIGPDGTPRDYEGTLEGTPVLLGCSDSDPHIPVERVRESADAFDRLDADVDERIYEGMGHTVNDDELRAVADLVEGLLD